MATVTLYPSSHSAVSGTGWVTTPQNAYSASDSNAVASTATISKSSTASGDFAGFNFSSIPANAYINSVTIEVRWRHTGSSTGATLGAYLVSDGATKGSELTRALVTTLTADSSAITAITRADLDADFAVRVRATRATSNTVTNGELEYVRIIVDYSTPVGYTRASTANAQINLPATTYNRSGSADIAVSQTGSRLSDANSAVLWGKSIEANGNSDIQTSIAVTSTGQPVIQISSSWSALATAAVVAIASISGSADALAQSTAENQLNADSVVQISAEISSDTDILIQQPDIGVSSEADANIELTGTKFRSAEADTCIGLEAFVVSSADVVVGPVITFDGLLATDVVRVDDFTWTGKTPAHSTGVIHNVTLWDGILNPTGDFEYYDYVTYERAIVSDVVVQQINSTSSSADVAIQLVSAANSLVDTTIQAAKSCSTNADGYTRVSRYPLADATTVIRSTASTASTADVYVEDLIAYHIWSDGDVAVCLNSERTSLADSSIRSSTDKTATADIDVALSKSRTGSADATIRQTVNRGTLADSEVALPYGRISTGDTAVQTGSTKASTADANIGKVGSESRTATGETVIRSVRNSLATADAPIRRNLAKAASADVATAVTYRYSATSEAAIRQGFSRVSNADVVVETVSGRSRSSNADVTVAKIISKSLIGDSVIRLRSYYSGTGDAYIATRRTPVSTADGLILRSAVQKAASADCALRASSLREGNADTVTAVRHLSASAADCSVLWTTGVVANGNPAVVTNLTRSVVGSVGVAVPVEAVTTADACTSLYATYLVTSVADVAVEAHETQEAIERAMETAHRLITKYGRDLDLVKFVDGPVLDPAYPWRRGPSGEYIQTCRGVFLRIDKRYIDGELIHRGDEDVLIAALDLEKAPNLKGEIRVDGVKWKIIRIKPLSPNGTDILYRLQVRQ